MIVTADLSGWHSLWGTPRRATYDGAMVNNMRVVQTQLGLLESHINTIKEDAAAPRGVEESLVAICTALDALTDEFHRRLPE